MTQNEKIKAVIEQIKKAGLGKELELVVTDAIKWGRTLEETERQIRWQMETK